LKKYEKLPFFTKKQYCHFQTFLPKICHIFCQASGSPEPLPSLEGSRSKLVLSVAAFLDALSGNPIEIFTRFVVFEGERQIAPWLSVV